MKKPIRSFSAGVLLLFTAVFFLSNPANAQQTLISINGWNAYVHLPASYSNPANASKTYPTILFFPGLGEVGTNASSVILNGPGAYITQGWNGNVQVGTDSVEFIVISLQPPSAWPVETIINTQIQKLKSLYRINNKRLYLTGLSMGGWCATTFVTGDPYGGPYTYASQVAAIVDVEGVVPDDNQPYPTLFDNFALSGGRLVGFQQANDNRDIPSITGRMNQTVSNSAIFIQTNYSGGGHCCWEQFYGGLGVQPGVFSLDGINQTLYQWLARQNVSNIAPVANAGADQTILLPTTTTTLTGSGTDADGTVASYTWTEVGGPIPVTINNASTKQASISGLIQGVYQFALTITDNGGAIGADTVQVTVTPAGIACNTAAPVRYIQGQSGPGAIYLINGGPWKGGDTIRITPGNYPDVIEFDHVHGDPCHPVTIINDGGLVSSPAIRLKNDCYYVHLTGTGAPGIPYGFKVVNGPLTISMSHHIEFDHVEAVNPGGVGVFMKVIPDTTAPGSWYINGAANNYSMNKLYIHDNWIHNTGNEGMYIGATDPNGGQHGNDAFGKPLLPLRLDSVEISNNLVENTGWDGIQLSNARDGAQIHDNIIRHYGLANAGTQQAGIILGGNTSGSIYNNKITQGTGNGVEAFGYGKISVYNNYFDSTGVDSTANGQESYESDDYLNSVEMNPKQQIIIYNNAFNHPQPRAAIRINSDYNNSVISNIHDNTFCIPGAAANWQTSYIVMGTGGPNTNNILYCPTVVSPGIPKANAGSDVTIKLPTNTAALSGSGSDANGQIGSYKWIQVSGPSTGTIANAAIAQTTVTGLIQGVYKFSLTVKDTSGVANIDTMQVTVSAANIAPVAKAGSDISITLPINSATLSGSGTDADGTIASYQWALLSGPSSNTIASATSTTTSLTALIQGVYKYTLTVTDNSGATGKDTVQVTVNAAIISLPVISSGTTATITTGKAFTYTITGTNTPTSYNATGLPAGLSINTSTGIISGTPTATGTSTVVISAINAGGTGTANLVITINPPAPIVSSATTANGTTGKAFSYTITASNTPTSYSATGLPSGLSINTSTGIISGTPTATGTSTVVINAINAGGTGTANLVITINPPAPVLSSATTASGTTGKAFTYTITASNTPTSYSATGLPSGLSINTSTGIISGTPTATGTSTVVINAINAGGTGTANLVIIINPPAPVLSSATTASGTTGKAFSYTITASNTPTSYSATGLPTGLSINTSTGVISGTPTATGTSTVVISAINAGGTGTANLVITINPPAPVVSSATTASGTTGKAFSYTITASNTPTSYSATGLPTGLSINTSTGVISGTPTATGTSTVVISAINAGGTGTANLVITINPPAPVVSSATTASGTTGKAFTYTITASNTPTSYSATGLPSGLTINTSTGVISGTPTATGTSTVVISAINAGGTGTANLVITVNPPIPVVSSAATATGTIGTTFSYTITGSNTPTSYNATGLPSGININTSTGVISGTPTVNGTFSVTISATNAGGTGTGNLVITINSPAPVISSANAASGTTVSSFSYTITASNAPTSYNATGLPEGLSINTSTGIISGTPSASGTFVVTISATNSTGTGVASLSIAINPPAPAISSLGTATGITGAAFNYAIMASNNPSNYNATGLPTGLSVDASTGVISGTPTLSGVFTVMISAANSGGTGSRSLVITISVPLPVLTGAAAASAVINTSFTYSIIASNNPTGYNATGLPAGLTIDTATGIISGAATVGGVFNVSINAVNAGGTATATLALTIETLPVVNAGADQIITLPANTVTLTGTATNVVGAITSYQWAKISGPASGTITSAGASATTVTGLVAGVYKFVLKVSNNLNASTNDTVQVTVNTKATANAGTDQAITLPVSSATLTGSGTDIGGTISSYLWVKISGPASGTITTPSATTTTITALTQGTYKFALTVTDNFGSTAKDTVQITVNPASVDVTNIPPVAHAGTDQLISLPLNNTVLDGSGTDVDGTIASYAWTKLSGPATGTITNATASGTTVTNLTAGTYKFVLTVTDNKGATGKDTVQISVNTPPVAKAGADQSIVLPVSTVTLNGSGTDADGTISTYQWAKISGPASAAITSATSKGTTVTALSAGIYAFELTVTDNNGAVAKDTMLVNVLVNIPPVANAGTDQTITTPANSVTLKGSGTDADGTIASYQWTKLSGPASGTITTATSAGTTVTGLTAGIYKFVLTVTDNNGAASKDTVQVTVNIPPVANAGVDQIISLPVNTITLTGNGTDADGTIASYQWTKLSGPASGTIATAKTSGAALSNLTAGTYKYQLTVTDNNGAVSIDTVQIIVNAPPIANAGKNQVVTLPLNSITLAGTGTDADGKVVSYQWVKIAGPADGTIANAATATALVSGMAQGIYLFELTVTDNYGATNKDTVQVILNLAPIVNAGIDQAIVLPTNKVSLSGTAVDVDGSVAVYKWTEVSGPTTATIGTAASNNTTVSGFVTGVYKFMLTATDNNGGIGRDSLTVTVNAGVVQNIPPVANAGTDLTAKLPAKNVTLTGSGKDADGTIASYQWAQLVGSPAVSFSAPTSAHTNVKGFAATGTYQFVLTVTDNKGAFGKDTVTVTITPSNVAPFAIAGTDISIALPANDVTLTGSGTDADGTIVSYRWTKLSGQTSGQNNSANTAIFDLSNLKEGIYKYELTVTDNDGATAKDTIQVTVTANASMEVFAAPNPVRSSVTAQVNNIPSNSKKLTVSLTTISGATVYTTIVAATTDTQTIPINMSNLRTGMYFLKIVADGGKPIVKTLFKN